MSNADLITGDNDGWDQMDPQSNRAMVQVAAASSRELAMVQAASQHALANPRAMAVARKTMLQHCGRRRFAESAVYAYPKGNTVVKGPSIHVAEMMLATWGNMIAGWEVLETLPHMTKVRAYCIDLQTNSQSFRTVDIKHQDKRGQNVVNLTDPRDVQQIVANYAQRAKRACILTLIPQDIIDECCDACDQTMERANDNGDGRSMVEKTIEVFAEFQITRDHIESEFEMSLDRFTQAQFSRLRHILTTIRQDRTMIPKFFSSWQSPEKGEADARVEPEKAPKKKGTAGLKDTLPGTE
ncbi:MAG: hypothetical protein HC841_00375 [Verrucomicrobiae bacterium]|nr:hypothetical protein [Verrucomicrobiae bacterium]